MADWRVIVVDEKRFCIVGTLDLTFDECAVLDDRRGPGFLRLPQRTRTAIGSFEVAPDNEMHFATVRSEKFYKRGAGEIEQLMLHVVIGSNEELDNLRRTGRFREWDADLREPKSSR